MGKAIHLAIEESHPTEKARISVDFLPLWLNTLAYN